jgi:hypothetical protein
MMYYPATVVEVDKEQAVVRFDETGHQIRFAHAGHNALPEHLRKIGARGFVSFPTAPARFTETAAIETPKAAGTGAVWQRDEISEDAAA